MKNLFIAALLAVSLTTTAFATDENKISVSIRQNFRNEFKGIDKVDWTLKRDFVKASFVLNGEKVEAFYDFKGDKIGTSHHITLADLPLTARRMIAKKYAGYNITEAVEFNSPEEDCFYISADNEKERLVLKITDNSSVSTFKKTRKDKFW